MLRFTTHAIVSNMKRRNFEAYVILHRDLLSDDNHLEVRYNAAGVLSHICSDGENAWTLNKISRAACMEKVVRNLSIYLMLNLLLVDLNSGLEVNKLSIIN